MKFTPTSLAGVWVLEQDRREDVRGYFARTWCRQELAEHGLNPQLAQCSVSFNRRAGTLRGLHFQAAPQAEAKLVQCVGGILWDVAVDLRPNSPSYRQWFAAELRADQGRMLYLPEGCAHGFQCLTDDCQILYYISEPYHPELTRGIRWNDPDLAISWPLHPPVLSERDQNLPLLRDL